MPEKTALYVHAGDICRSLKHYEEAFAYWQKALELDPSYFDALYSMGFCYEELEQFQNAYQVWSELVCELDRRGLVIEQEYPAHLADQCVKKMK